TALAVSAAGPGLTPLSAEELATVTGGTCTTCQSSPDPDPEPPRATGASYWEQTGSPRLLSRSNPTGQLIWMHSNHTNAAVSISAAYTVCRALSWNISGGINAGIARAKIGQEHDTSNTRTVSIGDPARTIAKRYVSYPVTRHEYNFTRWQDYTDGSR